MAFTPIQIISGGFNVSAACFLTPDGVDAFANPTYDLTGVFGSGAPEPGNVVGMGFLIPSDDNGQQIDAIACAWDHGVELSGVRIAVLAQRGTLQSLATLIAALPATVAGFYFDPHTDVNHVGAFIPDLSGNVRHMAAASPFLGLAGGQLPGPNGLVSLADVTTREPGAVASGVQKQTDAVIRFSARPGGGLVVPAGLNACVCVLSWRRLTSLAPAVGTTFAGMSLRASVHGGPLAYGQATRASDPVTVILPNVGGGIPRAGVVAQ